jgi:putative membrane protein insertion efficiency factor
MFKKAVIWTIRWYQKNHIKPRFYRRCIYTPTCSEYAIQALGRYGFIKGGWLFWKRLRRCRVGNPGGHDPL